MGSMSLVHWILVILVLLIVFGPKRLGDVGKSIGEGIKGFKKGLSDDSEPSPKAKEAGADEKHSN